MDEIEHAVKSASHAATAENLLLSVDGFGSVKATSAIAHAILAVFYLLIEGEEENDS